MVSFFAVGATFFAVPPLVPTLRSEFDLTNLALGLLMGAIAIPAIALSIPLGAALDRWPPRAAGLSALTVMFAGAAMFSLAPTYSWLLAGRLLFGAGALLLNLLLARVLTAAFAGRELGLAMGLFTGTYPASMIVLFSLHPWLEAGLGWRGEMGLLAGLVLLALPLHLLAIPTRLEHRGERELPVDGPRFSRPLVALGCAWMLYFAAFAAVPTFAPEWAGGGSAGLLITSLITWVALFATPAAGGLIDRTGSPERWALGGLTLLAITLAAMAAGLPAAITMMSVGIVAGVLPAAVYALPAVLVSPARVGLAFGFITALSNLGTVVGPVLAGAVRDATHRWPVLWLVLSAVAVAGAMAAGQVRRPEAIPAPSQTDLHPPNA